MNEQSADAKVLAGMAEGLSDLSETLEKIVREDPVAVRLTMSSAFAIQMIQARQALGRGEVQAVEVLLRMVDPILRDAADQLNERYAADRGPDDGGG